jgi:hypothetical protein
MKLPLNLRIYKLFLLIFYNDLENLDGILVSISDFIEKLEESFKKCLYRLGIK